jgi:tetratricopeptide (TPR) repeat protein
MQPGPDHLLAAARERFALQDYYGTVHVLEEVIASGGAYADAHHLLGLAYSFLGRAEQALAAFEAALERNPRYFEALIHRGLVLTELGRADEAEESFRRASAASAETVAGFAVPTAARLANQHAALGELYAEAGAAVEAIAQYRRALELGPTFHDLRYRLARLLLEAGRALEAREELERVVAARPGFADAEAALGLAHFLAGDALAARDVWLACRARGPENARVEAYLAMVERAAG